jgi:hypothetical protein
MSLLNCVPGHEDVGVEVNLPGVRPDTVIAKGDFPPCPFSAQYTD